MTGQVKIRPANGTWVVRAGGAVLGESGRALEVTVGDETPVIYFPREDIATAFLDNSDTVTDGPFGKARHFSIVTKSATLRDTAWSFEEPAVGCESLAGHLAFRAGDTVAVEEL